MSSVPLAAWFGSRRDSVAALILFCLALSPASGLTARLSAQATPANPEQEKKVEGRLEVGKPVEKTLGGGETHSYEIAAETGQFLHAVVEQLGIDVALTLYGPDGKSIASMDSPNGSYGLEQLSTITESSGIYRLEIVSGDKNVPAGRYRVTVNPFRVPSDQDRGRVAAERTLCEAVQLQAQGSADSLRVAMQKFEATLPLWHSAGDTYEEALTLDSIGSSEADLGEKQKALDEYSRSMALSLEVGDPLIQKVTLGHLMKYWLDQKQAETAVFFGKQAINKIQQIRANINGLEKEDQQSFLKSNEIVYRELADLLITQGRLPEAQQVLDLLKNEEYFEFIRRDGKDASSLTAPVNLTKSEEALNREFEENAGRVTAIGNEWAALRSKPSRTPGEEKHLAELSKQLELANEAWEKFLSGLYVELGKSKEAQASIENLQESASGMQRVVRQLGSGTVALYTLVGEQKYRVIVVTPTVMVAREYPISAEELRKKVFEFRQALLNPKSHPEPKAREMYQILVGPAARDLEGAKAVTLMWSLDDVLRYLPMAALHNGHGYQVEKYRNTVFTPASVPGLTALPGGAAWQGLGMGVSRAYGDFRALPAVPDELRGIIRDRNVSGAEGVMPGQMMLDETFTRDTMKKALEGKYPLVHIASHFAFAPGNETDSFLLLGGTDAQGQRLTLAEIRKDPSFSFSDTELLTLSACDTAVGGAEGDGREVDGLGILAQQKGARAVVASLWGVFDASTGLLMPEFYKEWTTHTDMPKAEALRDAQLALLRGTTGGPHQALYTHPYYWAPFILIGNWR